MSKNKKNNRNQVDNNAVDTNKNHRPLVQSNPDDMIVTELPEQNSIQTVQADKKASHQVQTAVISLAVAVAAALLIKEYVLALFFIPSASMEPFIHGRADGGDRILCSKLNFHWRGPRRWEVFVFEYPRKIGDQKPQNYIKRCVALPDEQVVLQGGNVYTRTETSLEQNNLNPSMTIAGMPGFVLRSKPQRIQQSLWIPVADDNFSDLSNLSEVAEHWQLTGDWEFSADKQLQLSSDASEATVTFRARSRDWQKNYALVDLDAIPDRYVLHQSMDFVCDNPDCSAGKKDASESESEKKLVKKSKVRKTINNQLIRARCPDCKKLLLEDTVDYYQRRSGLPTAPISEPPFYERELRIPVDEHPPQPRYSSYNFVGDLRFAVTLQFLSDRAEAKLELREDARIRQAVFTRQADTLLFALQETPDKATFSHQSNASELVNLATIPKLEKVDFSAPVTIELHLIDSVLRMFVNGEAVWMQYSQLPCADFVSGTPKLRAKGELTINRISIDRDIFYHIIRRGHKFNDILVVDGYTVLGDNQPNSHDSRDFGGVPESKLMGPALLMWWPPQRISIFPAANTDVDNEAVAEIRQLAKIRNVQEADIEKITFTGSILKDGIARK